MNNSQPRTLQDVALIAKEKHGGGGRLLERIATHPSAGHKITATTIDKILAGKYASRPSTATLDALAYLSGESKKTVYAAAGVIYNEVPIASQLPEGVDELDVDQRRTLITVARTLVHQARENHRLQLELQAQRKEQDVSNYEKAAEVVANMAEVAGIEQRATMEETLAALPEENNLRKSTEDVVRLILAGEPGTDGVEDPLRADVAEDGQAGDAEVYQFPSSRWDDPKNAAADDAGGPSQGQRMAQAMDEAGEGSQDPGDQS